MFNLHLPLFSFQLFIMFFVLLMPLCSAAAAHLLPLPSIQCTFCTFIHSTSSLNVPLYVLYVYILYSYIVWSEMKERGRGWKLQVQRGFINWAKISFSEREFNASVCLTLHFDILCCALWMDFASVTGRVLQMKISRHFIGDGNIASLSSTLLTLQTTTRNIF